MKDIQHGDNPFPRPRTKIKDNYKTNYKTFTLFCIIKCQMINLKFTMTAVGKMTIHVAVKK